MFGKIYKNGNYSILNYFNRSKLRLRVRNSVIESLHNQLKNILGITTKAQINVGIYLSSLNS